MKDLHPRLAEILRRAEGLIGSVESKYESGVVLTVEEMLRNAMSLDEDRERRVRINVVLNDLSNWYKSMPASRAEADGQILVRDTQAFAYLTLVPPRSGGKMPSFQDVVARIGQAGITEGIQYAALEAAYEKYARKSGLIYDMKFAECVLPTKGEPGRIDLVVDAFPKAALFDRERAFMTPLPTALTQVVPGQRLGVVVPGRPGKPGRSVRGEPIPAVAGPALSVRAGSGVRTSPDGGTLTAAVQGVLVQAADEVDVVPFYVVSGDVAQGQDIRFHGNVLVLGSVTGPVTITCEDLYVAGNVEGATVDCSGDVYIQGGIVGKRTGQVAANGMVLCRFISDGAVEAMGDVIVRDSIAYSDVTSNGSIVVLSKTGAIFGGTVAALKEICAQQIGSDFAAYTTTIVGKDFLTPRRLARVEQKIREYEEILAKIALVKNRLSEHEVNLANLPPQQQDIYIALLQREAQALQELNSLRRAKEKFDRAIEDFLSASIEVVESLHPPVKVQICSAVEEITQQMQRVTLVLDRGNRVFAMPRER